MTVTTTSESPRWSSGPTRGFWLWYAVLSGIALWMLHVTALSALAGTSCTHSAATWAMHALTLVLGAATIAGGWMCVMMIRGRDDHSEADPDLDGRLRFMGLFGLLTQAISLTLIIWEGTYVPFVDACR
jgi:hypothetical protein